MNFFDKILDRFGFQRKANSMFQVPIAPMGESMGQPTQQNYKAYLKQYAEAPWVYACIYRIASKGSEPLLKLYKKKTLKTKVEYKEITSHPILDLLTKANPYMTGKDMQETTIAHEELTGNAYWLLDNFVGGHPTEIYPLRPDRITIIPSKTEFIKEYEYEIGMKKSIILPKEMVVHFKYPNPTDDYYGLSPLAAARLAVDTQGLGDQYNRNFFLNSAMPEGALSVSDRLTPQQKKQLNHAWKQMHGGVGKSHKVAIMDGGLDWKQIGMSQKDMEFINSKKLTREDILGAFGVPPAMVGVFEYANYANAQEQREIFWRDTMIPKLVRYVSIINEFVVKPWDNTLEVRFDFSAVEALKENEKIKAETDAVLINSGVKTINEARAERGMEPVAWGNTWNRPMGLSPVPEDGETTPPEPMPDETDEEAEERQMGDAITGLRKFHKDIKPEHLKTVAEVHEIERELNHIEEKLAMVNFSEKHDEIIYDTEIKLEPLDPQLELKKIRDKKWEVYKDLEDSWEKKFIPILRKYFAELESEVSNNLDKIGWKSFCTTVRSTQKQNLDQRIDSIVFDVSDANKRAKKISRPIVEGSLEANAKKEIAALSLGIDFDLENPAVVEFINDKTFKFAKEVNSTTQEALRKELKEAVKEGEGIEEAGKRIAKVFDIARGPRTEAIARTEIIGSTNAGAVFAYEQSGAVKEKEWISTRDGNVRDLHQIDGETVGLKGTFSNGLKFPGDPTGAPENVINCRCTVSGVVER